MAHGAAASVMSLSLGISESYTLNAANEMTRCKALVEHIACGLALSLSVHVYMKISRGTWKRDVFCYKKCWKSVDMWDLWNIHAKCILWKNLCIRFNIFFHQNKHVLISFLWTFWGECICFFFLPLLLTHSFSISMTLLPKTAQLCWIFLGQKVNEDSFCFIDLSGPVCSHECETGWDLCQMALTGTLAYSWSRC